MREQLADRIFPLTAQERVAAGATRAERHSSRPDEISHSPSSTHPATRTSRPDVAALHGGLPGRRRTSGAFGRHRSAKQRRAGPSRRHSAPPPHHHLLIPIAAHGVWSRFSTPRTPSTDSASLTSLLISSGRFTCPRR